MSCDKSEVARLRRSLKRHNLHLTKWRGHHEPGPYCIKDDRGDAVDYRLPLKRVSEIAADLSAGRPAWVS